MSRINHLLLPGVLKRARSQFGKSQKTMALDAGLSPSRLCDLEQGRMLLTDQSVKERVFAALRSDPRLLEEADWAARHDRVIDGLKVLGTEFDAALVSATLVASRLLSPTEREGLTKQINRLAAGKQRLASLALEASSPDGEDSP